MKRQKGTICEAQYDWGASKYCGPTSLSAITGHGTAMICGWVRRRTGRPYVKGMTTNLAVHYLKEKGYEVELVWQQTKWGLGWPAGSEGTAITLRRFVEFHARPRDVYLINVTGHFLVLHKNKIVCTSTGGRIADADSSTYLRCRVKKAWRVS